MFKFLKEKLKAAVSKFTRKVEEEAVEEVKEIQVEKPIEVKTVKEELETLEIKGIKTIEEKEKPKEKEQKAEKKSILEKIKEKIITKKITADQFDTMFQDLEVALLENNVALEIVDKIKEDLKVDLVDIPLKRKDISNIIRSSLKESVEDLFKIQGIDLIKIIKKAEKPYIIVFVGINGSGKTTTIAKIVNLLKKNNLSCVLAASDTWRAASIEQLQEHADNLNVRLVKHNYGSDPAAVAFDAISMAKSKNIDVVLIDTAGRQHSNINLMAEMEKIIRVAKPDLKIFIGESITGNDCVEQAKKFDESIGIDAIILTKSDVDEKGGAAISISYITRKPIIYLGNGQHYDNLEEFKADKIINNIGL